MLYGGKSCKTCLNWCVHWSFWVFSVWKLGYTKERSSIVVIGLSIHTTPVEMREKLAIPEAEWPRAIGELCGLNHIEEAAVLSTCNRMEIYVVALSQHRGVKEVTEWMSKVWLILRFIIFENYLFSMLDYTYMVLFSLLSDFVLSKHLQVLAFIFSDVFSKCYWMSQPAPG